MGGFVNRLRRSTTPGCAWHTVGSASLP